MSKPSIFSKDYEKIMKKRRKKRAIIFFFVNILLIVGVMKVLSVDFSKVRAELQAWVDEGKSDLLVDNNEEQDIQVNIPKVEEKEKYIVIDIKQCRVEMQVKEEDNTIVDFKQVPEDVYFQIHEDGKFALILNNSQDMFLVDSNGTLKDITMKEYISQKGSVFKKENILKTYEQYIWTSEPKFLSENLVAYISNIPYFGVDLNQYITVVDLTNGKHTTLWNYKSKEIKFGDVNDKGLEVEINGNIKYVDKNGKLIW